MTATMTWAETGTELHPLRRRIRCVRCHRRLHTRIFRRLRSHHALCLHHGLSRCIHLPRRLRQRLDLRHRLLHHARNRITKGMATRIRHSGRARIVLATFDSEWVGAITNAPGSGAVFCWMREILLTGVCAYRTIIPAYPTTSVRSSFTSPEVAYFTNSAFDAPSRRAAVSMATAGPRPHIEISSRRTVS